MSFDLVENWSGRGPAGRDLVSQFRTCRHISLSFIHFCWLHFNRNTLFSALQLHLKAINGSYPSCGKEEKNSTLRAKLLWRNYSLHIESASLCPFKSEHIVQPPSSSLFDGEPHCLSYMSLPLVEDWSGGGPTGRDLVSRFQTVMTQKFVIHSLLLITF